MYRPECFIIDSLSSQHSGGEIGAAEAPLVAVQSRRRDCIASRGPHPPRSKDTCRRESQIKDCSTSAVSDRLGCSAMPAMNKGQQENFLQRLVAASLQPVSFSHSPCNALRRLSSAHRYVAFASSQPDVGWSNEDAVDGCAQV